MLGGVWSLRHKRFGGRRPYHFLDTKHSASGRWEMWMTASRPGRCGPRSVRPCPQPDTIACAAAPWPRASRCTARIALWTLPRAGTAEETVSRINPPAHCEST